MFRLGDADADTDTDTDFDRKLSRFGATSDIVFPLRDNYGAPTTQEELMGLWPLGKIGATVDYVRGDHVYRQGEIGVANIGTLRRTQTAPSTGSRRPLNPRAADGEPLPPRK